MSQSTVMVVDDEPDIRDLVREILEDEGYAVVVAEDVKSAREAIGESVPDLVLLDIWMPCLLYTSPSPRDRTRSRMPSSA